MNLLTSILHAIPILPTKKGGIGPLTNRSNPNSRLVSLMDITLNISDSFFGFTQKPPKDSQIIRDRDARYSGHFYRKP